MKDSDRRYIFGKNDALKRSYLFIAGLMLLLSALLFYCFYRDNERTLLTALEKLGDGEAAVSFDTESGFFEKGFVIHLTAADPVPADGSIEIRYTLNGEEPSADSFLYKDGIDLSLAYADALEEQDLLETERQKVISDKEAKQEEETESASRLPSLEDGLRTWHKELWTAVSDDGVRPERQKDDICVIPVRACLIQGEDKSQVETRTYVIGPGVGQRYQDVLVASVVTDPVNLFDYDQGIMIKGSHYQTDIDRGVRVDRSGNFFQTGDKWVKDGHVTLFSSDGRVLMEEDAGLNIIGYSSRNLPNRSFRAVALKERGSSGDCFSLDIFSSSSGKTKGSGESAGTDAPKISCFNKIKFRTHGIPTYHVRSVRGQYSKQLTDECGFYGLAENRLGVVFLNGEFYTVCDITPSTDKDYLCSQFGLRDSKYMEQFSGNDWDIFTKAKIIKLLTADLTDPAGQKALEQKVDMDNYLFYHALEVLFNNSDWPFNNVVIWRYTAEEDPDNPYTDGRFRFVLDDMDQILTNNLHSAPEHWSTEVFDYLMKDKGSTFHHVMECEKYRDTFLTYVDDLLNSCFNPDHACAVLDELYSGLKREYLLDYGQDIWSEMEHTAEVTKQNAREKEELYRADVEKYLGLKDRYTVRIEAEEGVRVSWNNDCGISPDKKIQSLEPGQTWTGTYYTGTSFTAEAAVQEGYRFTGWEINGVMKDDPAEDTPDTKAVRESGKSDFTSVMVSDALRQQAGTNGGEASVVTLRAVAKPQQ